MSQENEANSREPLANPRSAGAATGAEGVRANGASPGLSEDVPSSSEILEALAAIGEGDDEGDEWDGELDEEAVRSILASIGDEGGVGNEGDAPDGADADDADDADDAEGPEGSGASEDGEPSGSAAGELGRARAQRRASGKSCLRRVVLGLVVVVVLAAIGIASLFAWNRWGRFDDHADMQGEWYVEGTAVPVVIDAGTIHLSDSVAYKYSIDDREKTISYSFANWEGQGRYRFSDDRSHLVLTDGDFNGADTTVEDFAQTMEDLVAQVNGEKVELPQGEGIVTLCREADPQALQALQEQEAAKQAALDKAKAEAEAEDEALEDELYEE